MNYAGTNANPEKLGIIPIKNVLNENGSYSDAPVLPVYRTRKYVGNRCGTVVFFEVIGCDANCAHCYVHEDYLRARLSSNRLKESLQKLPGKLKGKLVHDADDIYDYGRGVHAKIGRVRGKAIELTGGEPSLYSGGIKRLGERAKPDGVFIIVKSNGYRIASNDDYLDAFEGLEDTIKFSFSVRGTTEEESERFAGVKSPNYHLVPFIAAEKVMQRGFEEPLLDVTIDTIADEEALKQEDNPIMRLNKLFESIGFKDFKNIDPSRITQQIFGNRFPGLDRKMVERGYWSVNDSGYFLKHTNPKAVEKFFKEKFGLKLE